MADRILDGSKVWEIQVFPNIWNKGKKRQSRSWLLRPCRFAEKADFVTRPTWSRTTPLGLPVVPEVYMMATGSVGTTSKTLQS